MFAFCYIKLIFPNQLSVLSFICMQQPSLSLPLSITHPIYSKSLSYMVIISIIKYIICISIYLIGEGYGNPLQSSCMENPRDGGAWWAAVYGVAQSRTRLKQLSSSSNIFEYYYNRLTFKVELQCQNIHYF